MARSISQIEDSIKTTIRSLNPTMDLEVGPIYGTLIAPVAPEISSAEASVERLQKYYSANFADVATDEEARDFAVNFATGPSIGGIARGTVVFYRNSTPLNGEIYQIKVGDIVSTADRRLLYRVTQTTQMIGDYASTFYNPSTNKYEIQAFVEAVASGTLYNIPAGRIIRIMSTVLGVDGVEQRSPMAGGGEPETVAETVARVQTKFLGLDTHSVGGIISTTKAQFPEYVTDVKIVRPTDRIEFRRVTDGPSLDLYILGSLNSTFLEEYLATGGETVVSIVSNRTVTSIASVSVGGTVIDGTEWIYIPDTSLGFQGSTKASPKIQLTTALNAGEVVEITGTKNSILDSVQALYQPNDNTLFKTDILARSFLDLPVMIVMDIRINTGDPDTIQAAAQTYLVNMIQGGEISDAIYPEVVKESLKGAIPEITAVKLLTFKRTYSSISEVEPIIPQKNQRPIYDQTNSNLVVRN